MNVTKKIIFLSLVLSGLLNAQGGVGLNINSEDVEITGSYDIGQTIGYTGGTSFSIEGSYLHNEKDDLLNIGFIGVNSLEIAPSLVFGFGLQTAISEDFIAIPLLAKVKYILPFDSDIPSTGILLSYAYAPSVLTFSDGDTYSEFRAETGMEIISNINVYAGYRNIETNYENFDYKLNDSFYGGFKLTF